VADYLRADCLAVFVTKTPDFRDLTADQRESLERHLNFARGLRIETRVLEGTDVVAAVVDFARLHHVTQIFVAREQPGGLRAWFAAAALPRRATPARAMQATDVADRSVPRDATKSSGR